MSAAVSAAVTPPCSAAVDSCSRPKRMLGATDGPRFGIYYALLRTRDPDGSLSCMSFAKLTSTLASFAGVAR